MVAGETGDWDALLVALEQRQTLIAEIDELSLNSGQITASQRTEARNLLERISQLDQEVSPKLNVAQAKTRAAMDEARLASTTVSAYRKSMSPGAHALPSKFVDKHK